MFWLLFLLLLLCFSFCSVLVSVEFETFVLLSFIFLESKSNHGIFFFFLYYYLFCAQCTYFRQTLQASAIPANTPRRKDRVSEKNKKNNIRNIITWRPCMPTSQRRVSLFSSHHSERLTTCTRANNNNNIIIITTTSAIPTHCTALALTKLRPHQRQHRSYPT